MAHERDDNRYDGQEDGEYHFSEDQGGYEVEPEITTTTTKAAPPAAPTGAPLSAKFSQYRKPIIGVGVFILLIFLVYKISAPSTSTPPNTDFAQNSGAIPSQKPVMKQLAKSSKTAQPSSEFQPLPPAAGMSNGSPTAGPAPTEVATAAPTTSAMPESAPPPPIPENVAAMTPPATAPMPTAPVTEIYNPTHPNTTTDEQLAQLTQENAKITAQFTQKLAEAQAQNAALQNQVQDLTQRLASMETTLANLGRVIQELKPNRSGGGGMAAAPLEQQQAQTRTAPVGEPKSTYTVQAIIPGRAWLKADNGETVTVAEGDILKNYGRIMKIDPYDGIVQIDTGNRIMNLAYGVSTD